MARYLTNTFSPMMIGDDFQAGRKLTARVRACSLDEIRENLEFTTSAISHDTTAAILSALLGKKIEFNRVNLKLGLYEIIYCIIPKFRADVAREFSREEVEAAGFDCFMVQIFPHEAFV